MQTSKNAVSLIVLQHCSDKPQLGNLQKARGVTRSGVLLSVALLQILRLGHVQTDLQYSSTAAELSHFHMLWWFEITHAVKTFTPSMHVQQALLESMLEHLLMEAVMVQINIQAVSSSLVSLCCLHELINFLGSSIHADSAVLQLRLRICDCPATIGPQMLMMPG